MICITTLFFLISYSIFLYFFDNDCQKYHYKLIKKTFLSKKNNYFTKDKTKHDSSLKMYLQNSKEFYDSKCMLHMNELN